MKKLITGFVLVLIIAIGLTSAQLAEVDNSGNEISNVNDDNLGKEVPYNEVPKVNTNIVNRIDTGGEYSLCVFPDKPREIAHSCYNNMKRRNIIAGLSTLPCPSVNPEFMDCLVTHGDNIYNRNRQTAFNNAVVYWGNIELEYQESVQGSLYEKQKLKQMKSVMGIR